MPIRSIDDVVRNGFCVGCGACSVASGGAVGMTVNAIGAYEARLPPGWTEPAELAAVCPFSDESEDEDAISRRVLPTGTLSHDPRLGHVLSVGAGRVADVAEVRTSSSGGLGSWLLGQMLDRGMVDGIIHVESDASLRDGRLFRFCISRSREEMSERKKSQYYSVQFADALKDIAGDGKRYAVVGVPCFIKAARLLCLRDPVLAGQLAYFVALVCGHMKSSGFAEALAWQVGVAPSALARVDFRRKNEDRPANAYSFGAQEAGDASWHSNVTRDLLGGNWGHAMFQLRACDYCDDIFGETADISLGDAWLPRFSRDWRGTNVVVCRNAELDLILAEGRNLKEIEYDTLSIDDAAQSQAGNYRHRWDGLSVRLADGLEKGLQLPRKRIKPGSRPVPYLRRQIVRLRQAMSERSHTAFADSKAQGSLDPFVQAMMPMVAEMAKLQRRSEALSVRMVVGRLVRRGRRLVSALRGKSAA